MLFKRRNKPQFRERMRVAVWPRRTWARSFRYVAKRVLRLSATPHAVAAGFAAGALASITPFVGLHFILAGVLAYVTGGNLLASAFGTVVGNPLTFPFIWAGTYRLGSWILGFDGQAPPPIEIGPGMFEHSWEALIPMIKPMLVGAVPIGIIVWFVGYTVVRSLVRTYQEGRRTKFAERDAARRAAEAARHAAQATNPGE